jgi:hypothetical protein
MCAAVQQSQPGQQLQQQQQQQWLARHTSPLQAEVDVCAAAETTMRTLAK